MQKLTHRLPNHDVEHHHRIDYVIAAGHRSAVTACSHHPIRLNGSYKASAQHVVFACSTDSPASIINKRICSILLVLPFIVPTLHGTQLLLEDLLRLKNAPKIVMRLVEDVHSVEAALKLLQSLEDREWDLLSAGVAKKSKTMISSCDFQRWTR
jgi:hypothetical protein